MPLSITVNNNQVVDKPSLRFAQGLLVGINTLVLLPPILMQMGADNVAQFLYRMLGLLCHQRADRSFYLFGESLLYPKETIWQQLEFDKVFAINPANRFTCSDSLGCKFGVCARCTGTYLGLLLGLIAAEFLMQWKIPKIIPILMLLPMAIDGGIQTFAYILAPEQGFYESTNPRRFFTGLFFGLGTGYLLAEAIMRPVTTTSKVVS